MSDDVDSLDRRIERLFAWSGMAWVFFSTLGFFGSGFVPAWSPSTDPAVLVAYLTTHKTILQFGMQLILIGSYTFLVSWGLGLAYQIRKYANPSRLIYNYSNNIALCGGVIGMLTGVFGAMILMRLDRLAPATVQGFYDVIWFMFLIPWAPFTVWQFMVGAAILSKTNDEAMFPRWSGYFAIWAGILEVPSCFAMFWYSGPFAYNGAVSFYVPGVSFFIWVFVMSWVQIKGWARVQSSEAGLSAQERFRNAVKVSCSGAAG